MYTDFVMTTVASEDNSRVIRSSSPFGLYSSGVNTLTGLPNGQKLVDIPLNAEKATGGSPWPAAAEQHGPYQHGGIFPAINAGGSMIANPPVVIRAANSGGPGGPTRPLGTPFRTPGTLSGLTETHRKLCRDPLTLASGTIG